MEPLSILQKMVLDDAKVPDDHVIVCMHTPRFRSVETYFFRGAKMGLQGALFLEFFLTTTPSTSALNSAPE